MSLKRNKYILKKTEFGRVVSEKSHTQIVDNYDKTLKWLLKHILKEWLFSFFD